MIALTTNKGLVGILSNMHLKRTHYFLCSIFNSYELNILFGFFPYHHSHSIRSRKFSTGGKVKPALDSWIKALYQMSKKGTEEKIG